MARIIHSTGVTFGSTPSLTDKSVGYSAGAQCPDGLPALYDKSGHFVAVVNHWLLELKTVKRLVDINTAAKALLRYWKFLERENLQWNQFSPVNRLKPTYRFRSEDLLASARGGRMAFSTASSCMLQVVRFYTWAIESIITSLSLMKEKPRLSWNLLPVRIMTCLHIFAPGYWCKQAICVSVSPDIVLLLYLL